jgi:COP9 signalosome complex subunit 2
MKEVFALTEKFNAVIEDDRVKSVIQECGGKMFMTEKKWESAFNAFKTCYESMVLSGHPRAPTLLKYVILT